MTEQELNDLQRHSAVQDARISNLETKFEMFMQSIDRSFAEMRERDKIRAEEMQDFKNEMRARDDKRAAEIAEIRGSIDSTNKHVRNLTITAMVGIGAMVMTSVIGIAAMIWSVVPK